LVGKVIHLRSAHERPTSPSLAGADPDRDRVERTHRALEDSPLRKIIDALMAGYAGPEGDDEER
jgi:hypothetical protein